MINELGFDEDQIESRELAVAHACLGESALFVGSSKEAVEHLEKAKDLYEYCESSGDTNQLEVANVLHFLGEAYSYRQVKTSSMFVCSSLA